MHRSRKRIDAPWKLLWRCVATLALASLDGTIHVWTDEGSPLLFHGQALTKAV